MAAGVTAQTLVVLRERFERVEKTIAAFGPAFDDWSRLCAAPDRHSSSGRYDLCLPQKEVGTAMQTMRTFSTWTLIVSAMLTLAFVSLL
jgi:hypothetical protein